MFVLFLHLLFPSNFSTFFYQLTLMNRKIKVFLESPKTQELASEANILKSRQKLKENAKIFNKSRKNKRKNIKLPSFIPMKNVYEQQDLSKLTERQRILALKFQTMKDKASNLFLAVNNLNTISKAVQPCSKCITDFESLKSFTFWLIKQHNCLNKKRIEKTMIYLKKASNQKQCLCDSESLIYSKVSQFLGLQCCRNESNTN